MFKEIIQDELVQFDEYMAKALRNDKSHVSDIVEYAFKRDGKRIRPMLVFLVAKAVTPPQAFATRDRKSVV